MFSNLKPECMHKLAQWNKYMRTRLFSSFSKGSKALTAWRYELSSQPGDTVLSIAIMALTTCYQKIKYINTVPMDNHLHYDHFSDKQRHFSNLFPIEGNSMSVEWNPPLPKSWLKWLSRYLLCRKLIVNIEQMYSDNRLSSHQNLEIDLSPVENSNISIGTFRCWTISSDFDYFIYYKCTLCTLIVTLFNNDLKAKIRVSDMWRIKTCYDHQFF